MMDFEEKKSVVHQPPARLLLLLDGNQIFQTCRGKAVWKGGFDGCRWANMFDEGMAYRTLSKTRRIPPEGHDLLL